MKAGDLKPGDTVTWANRVRAKVADVQPDGDRLRIDWEGYREYSLYPPGEEVEAERGHTEAGS